MEMKRRTNFRNDERGSAILIALFALLLVSAIGFGMMYSSSTETNVNANFRDSQRAYLAARGGLEEVRQRMARDSFGKVLSNNPIAPPAGMPDSALKNIFYVVNPTGAETIDPTGKLNSDGTNMPSGRVGPYADDELCQEGFSGLSTAWPSPLKVPCDKADVPKSDWLAPAVNSVLPGTGAADALSYKWVRVTTKANLSSGSAYPVDSSQASTNPGGQVCWTGDSLDNGNVTNGGLHEVVIPAGTSCASVGGNPAYLLTALAVGPQGSRRMAQMEISIDPPISTNGTVDSQAAVTLQGSLNINSYDNCTCDLTKNPPVDKAGASCVKDKWAVYSANNIGTKGSANVITSGQPGGNPPGTSANSTWPYDVPKLIDKYKNLATNFPFGSSSCPTGGCGATGDSYGAVDANFNPLSPKDMKPQITYIPGDTKLTANVTGAGILIVDGDLDIHGGLEWYGLVLVKGTIDFTGGAGDKVNLYGAFLNGKDVTATNDDFGGSVVLQYDSCALNSLNQTQAPRILSSRELMY